MTFLFLGLDGMDFELMEEFDFEAPEPVNLSKMKQDLPEVIAENGSSFDNDGWWTFYVWGAIARGNIQTPEMRQEHPTRSEVRYPHSEDYFYGEPSQDDETFLMDDPAYFAWDFFENVKVINYPIHLPEYCRNCKLFRKDATSRDYGPTELQLLKAEINTALQQNYEAVFAVTRVIDCNCHGATMPSNHGSDSVDDWFENRVGKDFEEMHDEGINPSDFDRYESGDGSERPAVKIKQDILDHVQESYDGVENFLKAIDWSEVTDHVVISDHGFDKPGAGSVNAHGPYSVFSSSLGSWDKMSGFIMNWRQVLEQKFEEREDKEEFEGDKSEEEKVKDRLEKLGYK